MNDIINLSTQQLRHVADLKEKIESLQDELSRVLGGAASVRVAAPGNPGKRTYRISAAARARIAAAQKARWAKFHASRPVRKKTRVMSAAAKAKIAAAARRRWAAAKAAGKSRL